MDAERADRLRRTDTGAFRAGADASPAMARRPSGSQPSARERFVAGLEGRDPAGRAGRSSRSRARPQANVRFRALLH